MREARMGSTCHDSDSEKHETTRCHTRIGTASRTCHTPAGATMTIVNRNSTGSFEAVGHHFGTTRH